MIRLTVEETNLLSIYNEDGKRGLTENFPTNRKRVCGACYFRR